MPNGFPAFRFDPTIAPRYIIRTAKNPSDTASTTTGSSQQSVETAKQSEYQYPTERGSPKKSHSRTKEAFKRLLG